MPLSYALVTPAHDEEADLPRLAEAVAAQTVEPGCWIIVDDGSTDGTLQVAQELEQRYDWVHTLQLPSAASMARGGPVVRSFSAGLRAIETPADVVVKVDADVSLPPDYFERLLSAFESDARLGIASGSAYELEDGVWRQRFSTGTSVWGAVRAYRSTCLRDLLPLDERMGWDAVDEHKAHLRGWSTATMLDLPFFHHRSEGGRDATRYAAWQRQGEVAYYLGYRPSYLLLRTAYRILREPAALGMAVGYLAGALRRAPRCTDTGVRRRVREQQRLRRVGRRAREALGKMQHRETREGSPR